jgi:hypothetical protein
VVDQPVRFRLQRAPQAREGLIELTTTTHGLEPRSLWTPMSTELPLWLSQMFRPRTLGSCKPSSTIPLILPTLVSSRFLMYIFYSDTKTDTGVWPHRAYPTPEAARQHREKYSGLITPDDLEAEHQRRGKEAQRERKELTEEARRNEAIRCEREAEGAREENSRREYINFTIAQLSDTNIGNALNTDITLRRSQAKTDRLGRQTGKASTSDRTAMQRIEFRGTMSRAICFDLIMDALGAWNMFQAGPHFGPPLLFLWWG